MGRVAGADDQHVILSKRRQRTAELDMMQRPALRLNGKLDDRNRGVWKHMAQRNPYAVIEATAAVNSRGDAGALEQRDDLAGERRLTGRPVLDVIELRRKTAKIMNRLRFGIPGHHRHRGFPMRRRNDHGARVKLAPQRCPHTRRLGRRDRVHGRTVR